MSNVIRIIFSSVFVFLSIASNAGAQDKVVIQLRWEPQFQFAGYYAALWQGYYEKAGLDVEIRHAFDGDQGYRNAVAEVAAGRAQFGVGSLDFLQENDSGTPMSLVASIFQQSPTVFFVKPELDASTADQLAGLRIVRNRNGSMLDLEMQAFFHSEGINIENITFITGPNNTELFISEQADAIVGHRFGERVISGALGQPPRIIEPAKFGINFYGDSLFTTQQFASKNPDLVSRFRKATLEGWQYAMTNQRQIIEQLINTYDRKNPVVNEIALNLDQAEKLKDLTLYPIVTLGNTNPRRWEAIHDSLLSMGFLNRPLNSDNFIFDPERLSREATETRQRTVYWVIGILATLLVAATFWTVTLRRSVNRATRELANALQAVEISNKKLRRSNNDLEEFAYVAAHDLQEPLRKIQSFGQLIQHDQAKMLDDRGKEYFGLMTDAANRMQRLIAALLSYSRVASRTEEFRKTSLQKIYDDVIGDLSSAMSESSAQVTAAPLPEIVCDETQIHQLLQNLIGNALKFRHPERDPVINISCEMMPKSENLYGPVTVIRVSDNGIGIEEKYRKSIFEPFKRLHDREDYPGTGIGLAICQKIITRHDGHISVGASSLGGAEFIIELPAWNTASTTEENQP